MGCGTSLAVSRERELAVSRELAASREREVLFRERELLNAMAAKEKEALLAIAAKDKQLVMVMACAAAAKAESKTAQFKTLLQLRHLPRAGLNSSVEHQSTPLPPSQLPLWPPH